MLQDRKSNEIIRLIGFEYANVESKVFTTAFDYNISFLWNA